MAGSGPVESFSTWLMQILFSLIDSISSVGQSSGTVLTLRCLLVNRKASGWPGLSLPVGFI